MIFEIILLRDEGREIRDVPPSLSKTISPLSSKKMDTEKIRFIFITFAVNFRLIKF